MNETIDSEFIYEQARALCYGVAGSLFHPAVQFNDRERMIIDAIAEWMGSRDCEIAKLRGALDGALRVSDNSR